MAYVEDNMPDEELDELLVSLMQGHEDVPGSPSSTSTESVIESVGHSTVTVLPAPMRAPKRSAALAASSEEYPLAYDEETRKARKMARNRRAAATSRQRKKEQMDSLATLVHELQEENACLRRRLQSVGLLSEGCDAHQDLERPISIRQPAVLPRTHSPQLECYQPFCLMVILPLLALMSFLRRHNAALGAELAEAPEAPARTEPSAGASHTWPIPESPFLRREERPLCRTVGVAAYPAIARPLAGVVSAC